MNILERFQRKYEAWILLIPFFVFLLLRFPSLFEPYWYGDEGINQVIGMALNSGRVLYQDIWDNKPPLLYLLYQLCQSDQFTVRLVSLVFGILSVFTFYMLSKKLFSNQYKTTYFLTLVFAFLFATPYLEGNIANAENFMLLPILLSAFLILSYSNRHPGESDVTSDDSRIRWRFWTSQNDRKIYIAGILLSLAFLFKVVAVFDLFAFTVFLIITSYTPQKNLGRQIINLFPLFISFSLPILFTAGYFTTEGAFGDFVEATLGQNIGYIEHTNSLLIPQGILILKVLFLLFAILIIFWKRNQFSPSTLFILLWLSFSLFNAFFSGRPFTHYLLVLLPSAILFFGTLVPFKTQTEFERKIYKILAVCFFIIMLFVIDKNFWIYKKTLSYYSNFFSFVSGQKSVEEYYTFFDGNTPRDYELAQFLKKHLIHNETFFLWGDNPQLYKLTNKLPPGRYIAAYHILTKEERITETYRAIQKNKPKYIIVTTQKDSIPFPISNYKEKYSILSVIIYERTI